MNEPEIISVRRKQAFGKLRGENTNVFYRCPCGSGIIEYEQDWIPGYMNIVIKIGCLACKDGYELDNSVENAKWGLVKKEIS